MHSLGISPSHFPLTSFLFLYLHTLLFPYPKNKLKTTKPKYLSLILLPVELFSIFLLFLHYLILKHKSALTASSPSFPLPPLPQSSHSSILHLPSPFYGNNLPKVNHNFPDTTFCNYRGLCSICC